MVSTRARDGAGARAVAHCPLINRGTTREIRSLAVQRGSVIITTDTQLSERQHNGRWKVMDHASPNTTFGTLTVLSTVWASEQCHRQSLFARTKASSAASWFPLPGSRLSFFLDSLPW